MKKILLLFLVCAGVVIIAGRIKTDPATRGVVTQIEIYAQQQDGLTHLKIVDMEQMESVLHYLRAVDLRDPAKNAPLPSHGYSFTVLVQLANGKRHIYRQLSDRFFCRDTEGWKEIRSGQGSDLSAIIRHLSESIPKTSNP